MGIEPTSAAQDDLHGDRETIRYTRPFHGPAQTPFLLSFTRGKRGNFSLRNLCQFNDRLSMRSGLVLLSGQARRLSGSRQLTRNNHLPYCQENPVATMPSAIEPESNGSCGGRGWSRTSLCGFSVRRSHPLSYPSRACAVSRSLAALLSAGITLHRFLSASITLICCVTPHAVRSRSSAQFPLPDRVFGQSASLLIHSPYHAKHRARSHTVIHRRLPVDACPMQVFLPVDGAEPHTRFNFQMVLGCL